MKNIAKKLINIILIIKNRLFCSNKIKLNSNIYGTKFIGSNINIYSRVNLINSRIGKYSYIGQNSICTNIYIGSYCSISSGFTCAFGRHPLDNNVSTHPFFYSKTYNKKLEGNRFEEYKYVDDKRMYKAKIGNDVWIGTNVTILDGVTIGDGAVIGAGSVVTKDVEAYSIVVGVPAKKIRYRFDKETINFLNNLKWWDKDDAWLKKYSDKFDNINKIKEIINND